MCPCNLPQSILLDQSHGCTALRYPGVKPRPARPAAVQILERTSSSPRMAVGLWCFINLLRCQHLAEVSNTWVAPNLSRKRDVKNPVIRDANPISPGVL